MKTLAHQTVCPGCKDIHFVIECKKPTVLTPTTVNIFCDHCEATYLMRVSVPRKRSNSNVFGFECLKVRISDKLKQIWDKEVAKKTAKLEAELATIANTPESETPLPAEVHQP